MRRSVLIRGTHEHFLDELVVKLWLDISKVTHIDTDIRSVSGGRTRKVSVEVGYVMINIPLIGTARSYCCLRLEVMSDSVRCRYSSRAVVSRLRNRVCGSG